MKVDMLQIVGHFSQPESIHIVINSKKPSLNIVKQMNFSQIQHYKMCLCCLKAKLSNGISLLTLGLQSDLLKLLNQVKN